MHPGADVPLVRPPVLLRGGLDVALRVGAADEDASGLGVIDLVEDPSCRVTEVVEAQRAGDQSDGDDRVDGTVERVGQTRHRPRVPGPVTEGWPRSIWGGPSAGIRTASPGSPE